MSIAAYLRVSTGQQSIDQQHDSIAAAGITPDRVFTDTASGRAGSERPGWTECWAGSVTLITWWWSP
jgi:DNA invertase Pin-like site-specific DNA recombinase